MRSSPRLLFVLFAGLFALQTSAAAFDRLYVFGDSYSDFGAGYIDCNGPTAVAYLAWDMGLEFTHAKASNAAGKSIDFAVSGALTGLGEGRHVKDALLGYGMANQVRDFSARVKTGEIHFDPNTTLFFLAGGLNDRTIPTEATVANLRQEIETLKSLGGQHFTVALLPTRIPSYSAVGNRLNPALTQFVKDAREQLAVDLWINHWGADFDRVIDHPADYGITNTTATCAGRGIYDEDQTPVGDPATYFFYHHNHPSTAVHRIVGKMLEEEIRAQVGSAPAPVP